MLAVCGETAAAVSASHQKGSMLRLPRCNCYHLLSPETTCRACPKAYSTASIRCRASSRPYARVVGLQLSQNNAMCHCVGKDALASCKAPKLRPLFAVEEEDRRENKSSKPRAFHRSHGLQRQGVELAAALPLTFSSHGG